MPGTDPRGCNPGDWGPWASVCLVLVPGTREPGTKGGLSGVRAGGARTARRLQGIRTYGAAGQAGWIRRPVGAWRPVVRPGPIRGMGSRRGQSMASPGRGVAPLGRAERAATRRLAHRTRLVRRSGRRPRFPLGLDGPCGNQPRLSPGRWAGRSALAPECLPGGPATIAVGGFYTERHRRQESGASSSTSSSYVNFMRQEDGRATGLWC